MPMQETLRVSYPHGHSFEFGQLRRSQASGSSNGFIFVFVFFAVLCPNHQRLQNALSLESCCQFLQKLKAMLRYSEFDCVL